MAVVIGETCYYTGMQKSFRFRLAVPLLRIMLPEVISLRWFSQRLRVKTATHDIQCSQILSHDFVGRFDGMLTAATSRYQQVRQGCH